MEKVEDKAICLACTKILADGEGYELYYPAMDELQFFCEGCKVEVESLAFNHIPQITKR